MQLTIFKFLVFICSDELVHDTASTGSPITASLFFVVKRWFRPVNNIKTQRKEHFSIIVSQDCRLTDVIADVIARCGSCYFHSRDFSVYGNF